MDVLLTRNFHRGRKVNLRKIICQGENRTQSLSFWNICRTVEIRSRQYNIGANDFHFVVDYRLCIRLINWYDRFNYSDSDRCMLSD